MKLLPYQKKAIKIGIQQLKANNSFYLASFPGSGKSLMSLYMASVLGYKVIAILCPKIIKASWQEQAQLWVNEINKKRIRKGKSKWLPEIYISTYESVLKFNKTLEENEKSIDLFILDEATKIKNKDSSRTVNTFRVMKKHNTDRIYLSGTPMNRPHDLWSILSKEKIVTDWMHYIKRYCAGRHNGFTWVYSGSSNVKELSELLNPWMTIISDEEAGLPEIITSAYVLDKKPTWTPDTFKIVDRVDSISQISKFIDNPFEFLDLGEQAVIRRETGEQKAIESVKYLKDIEEPMVIFAQHKSVINYLEDNLKSCVTVYGDNSEILNNKNIELFKEGKASKIVLSLTSAKEGLTLINSNRVFFIEFPWNWSDVLQALKRVHRIGQTKSVYVQFSTLSDTFDKKIVDVLLRKMKTHVDFTETNNASSIKSSRKNKTKKRRPNKKRGSMVGLGLTS